ncbi:MAG: radical SAM protein [Candidatus Omnitrophota bacterium]
MNVTLLYPLLSMRRSKIDENKQYWPPLGLAYIAAVLERAGHSVQIIDRDVLLRKNALDFEKTDELTSAMVDDFGSEIVGITATTPNIPDAYHVAKMLKQKDPGRRIVLGGPHASGEPELTLKECRDIDIVVRGEGEFTLLDIAQNRPLNEIAGITYRDGERLLSTPDRELIKNIDDLPLPARHLLDMEFYTRPSRFTSRNLSLRTTSIFTARGCPYRCSFCAGPLVFKGKVRFHSKERVIAEIEELIGKCGIEGLYFAEDMFLSSMKRAEEILSLFVERGLHKKIKWFAQVKASLATEDLLTLMKGSGCVGVEFGFESGSQNVLDGMNKKITVAQNLEAARLAKKAGIRFQGNIIVGFPGETEQDFQRTLDFIWKAKPNTIGFNIFMPLPGTSAYNDLKRRNAPLPRWEDIGDPEAPQINFADMPNKRFEQLYFLARFKVILPINFYYFVKDNIRHPLRLAFVLVTQFRGVLIKSARAFVRLIVLKKSKPAVSKKALYLSYNGLLEPILPSQGLPYLRVLHKRIGIDFILVTWEKKEDLKDRGTTTIRDTRKRLADEGIEWRYLSYHKSPRHFSTLFDLAAGLLLCAWIIPTRRIGIVHARGITPGVIPLLLSRIFRVKLIYDMRGLLAEEYVGGRMWKDDGFAFRLVKRAERATLNAADAIVVLTRKHYDLNRRLGFPKDPGVPMEVVPCCVDTDAFHYLAPEKDSIGNRTLRSSLGLEGSFIFMYPGKIGTFYFIDEMLDFFSVAQDAVPEALLFVVTKDDSNDLMARAQKRGIDPSSIRIASSTFEEMPEFIRLADAGIFFINPYKKIGSSPIKLGEFLASGVPVVINPGVGDTDELVRKNKVGVVVERFSRDDYLSAIKELMKLKEERDELRRRCRLTAEQNLSLAIGVERYVSIYEKLLHE